MNPAQDQPQPHINQVRQALLQQLQTLGQLGKPGADGKPLDLEQIKTQVQLANAAHGPVPPKHITTDEPRRSAASDSI